MIYFSHNKSIKLRHIRTSQQVQFKLSPSTVRFNKSLLKYHQIKRKNRQYGGSSINSNCKKNCCHKNLNQGKQIQRNKRIHNKHRM